MHMESAVIYYSGKDRSSGTGIGSGYSEAGGAESPVPDRRIGDSLAAFAIASEYTEVLQGLPIHDVTASQLGTGLVEAFLHEPGS